MKNSKDFTLSNGVTIPEIGFGTWQIPDGEVCYNACKWALEAGYRHIDTAHAYENEQSVGRAVKDSGIPREEIFITTKLPSHIKTYDGAMEYFNQSLNNLDCGYIDLYLIHAPWPWSDVGSEHTKGNIDAWRAFIDLYNAKKVRAIGVSNFLVPDLEAIIDATGVKPMVNQIRYFIGNTQDKITDFCQSNGILVEAYSPLATGEIVTNEKVVAIAKKHNVTPANVCIKYCREKGTLPLPKSKTKERIAENFFLDFSLSPEDMALLDSLYHIGKVQKLRS